MIIRVLFQNQFAANDSETWFFEMVSALKNHEPNAVFRVYREGTAHPNFVHRARCCLCGVPMVDGEYGVVEATSTGDTDFTSWTCADCIYHWLRDEKSVFVPKPVPGALV